MPAWLFLRAKSKIISATIYLIPTIISEGELSTLPIATIQIIHSLKVFVVERARTARRFIKETKPPYNIEELTIVELDKRDSYKNELVISELLSQKVDFGLISESGMPGVADPGSEVVTLAHKSGWRVKPLVGPSSLFLALAASGLNGQNFKFEGYLPVKEAPLKKALSQIANTISKTKTTYIFIETPYRNDRLLATMLKELPSHIRLCLAKDISGKEEFIKTASIKEWRGHKVVLGKVPTVFLLGSN